MLDTMLSRLNSEQTTAILVIAIAASAAVLIAVPAILSSAWQNARTAKVEAMLKGQMLERGMSAEEILHVLQRKKTPAGVDLPCASEVVVQWKDDEWYPGLILKTTEGQCYVHYIGHEMSDNEWVPEGRVRFPARAGAPAPVADEGLTAAPRKAPMYNDV